MTEPVPPSLLQLIGDVGPARVVELLREVACEILDEGASEDEVRAVMEVICARLGLDPDDVMPGA